MEIISFRFQDFLSAFIILFAVIDITGLTPIIIDMKQKGQNIIAWKAAVYSLVTFLAFLFMGEYDTQSVSSRYFFVCHCRRAGYLRDGHRDVARGGDFQE